MFAAAIVAVSLLAGCGDGEDRPGQVTSDDAGASPSTTEGDDGLLQPDDRADP